MREGKKYRVEMFALVPEMPASRANIHAWGQGSTKRVAAQRAAADLVSRLNGRRIECITGISLHFLKGNETLP